MDLCLHASQTSLCTCVGSCILVVDGDADRSSPDKINEL